MAYTTVQKVQDILPHRTIDNESVVSLAEVKGLIVSVNDIVEARLKIAGHTTSEVEDASYTDILEVIETLLVAGWVEQRFKGDSGGDEGELPNNNYYKEGHMMLDKLAMNNEFDPISDVENKIRALISAEDDEDELKPHFHKNTREW